MRILSGSLTVLLLAACAAPAPEVSEPSETEQRMQIRTLSSAEVVRGANTPEGQRMIADLLFAGLQALDADRLLTPVDDNAHARFQRVLAYDPDNEIALQGLQNIVARYLELATDANNQGLFAEAEALVGRARFVDEDNVAIDAVWEAIQAEKNSGDLFFDFDARALAARSEAAQQQLVDIAQQAREHKAFFLITAPNDELARWMFSVMRDGVAGYRLRGNIELASRASIRLRMPEGED